MFDYKYLRLRILEIYGTIGNFAKAQNKKLSDVSRKLSSGCVDTKTIDRWVELLSIKPEMIGFYFFTRLIDNTQN